LEGKKRKGKGKVRGMGKGGKGRGGEGREGGEKRFAGPVSNCSQRA